MQRKSLLLAVALSVFCVGGVVSAVLFFQIQPQVSHVAYKVGTDPELQGELPVHIPETKGLSNYSIRFDMELSALHPTRFQVFSDDCIDLLVINRKAVPVTPLCNFDPGDTLDLRSYLQAGTNGFELRGHNSNGPGGFTVRTARTEILFILWVWCLGLTFMIPLWAVLKRWSHAKNDPVIAGLFTSGVLLQLIYTVTTPFTTRANDANGHLDYVKHLLESASLPNPADGWEFYHPPFYYAVSALWSKTGQILGVPAASPGFLQVLSLILSVSTLATCVWMASLLMPAPSAKNGRRLFMAVLCFFPALVFFSARINNDSLVMPLLFLSLALLLVFVQSGRRILWYVAAVACAFALITKSNALLMLPVLFGSLLAAPTLSLKKKVVTATLGWLLIAGISGWYYAPRFLHESHDTALVGNARTLDSTLKIPTTPQALLTFNPVAVVRLPFNDTRDDDARRRNFWEFLYRSAYFGEYKFADVLLSRLLLVAGMLWFPFMLLGLAREIRRPSRQSVPLLLTLGCFLAGHLAARIIEPFSSMQDFRYSLLILIPLAYFAVRSTDLLPRIAKFVARILLLALPILCCIFIARLYAP